MNAFVICNLNVFDQYLLFNVLISSKRIGSAVVLLLNWIFGFFRNNKMNFVDEIIPYLNRVFQKKTAFIECISLFRENDPILIQPSSLVAIKIF